MHSEEEFEVPAITICGYINRTILEPLVLSRPDIDFSNYTRKQIEDSYFHLNISDLHKYATTRGNLSLQCNYICRRTGKKDFCNTIPCERLTKVTTSIQWINNDEIGKCYTYFEYEYHSPETALRDAMDPTLPIYVFRVHSDHDAGIKILVHPGRNLPYTNEFVTRKFYSQSYAKIKLSYTDTRYVLLAEPYDTDCSYYKKHKHGRYGCISDCKRDWFKKR